MLSARQKFIVKNALRFLEVVIVILALAGLLAIQRGFFPDLNTIVFFIVGIMYLIVVLRITIRTRLKIENYLTTEPEILANDPYYNDD